MMEKEEAETVAIQEKADHKLKERLGKNHIDMTDNGESQDIAEETLFWTEEVESELNRWDDEKFKLDEVIVQLVSKVMKASYIAEELPCACTWPDKPSLQSCRQVHEAQGGQDRRGQSAGHGGGESYHGDGECEALADEAEDSNRASEINYRIFHKYFITLLQIEFQQAQNHSTIRLLSRDLGIKVGYLGHIMHVVRILPAQSNLNLVG